MKTYCTFRDWRSAATVAWGHVLHGLAGVVATTLLGLVSLSCASWRAMSRWVGRYPSAALTAFLAAVFATWLLTFAIMRARAVGAEDQRNMLRYRLNEMERIYEKD